ncbi:MAG: hypothetical protein DELT_00332 [Desulfovibrio sp.]
MAITVTPHDALITEKRDIVITSLSPGPARLITTLEKPDGSYWCSVAIFEVSPSGVIELGKDMPVSGDWVTADSMAPVWAMRSIRKPSAPAKSAEADDLVVQLTITDSSGAVQTGSFVQRFIAPGVAVTAIEHPELVGTVYYPAGEGPHPVVFGLNGSNGGMPHQRCALYAASGYIAVALAFFGAPGRPQYFGETPLEYFETAFIWAKEALKPKDDFIAVVGASRGGELSFLLGATFPEHVKAVVGFVPSAVVNGIQQAGKPDLPRDTPAWYYKGEPLPNLWRGNPDADVAAYTTPIGPGLPIRQDGAFIDAMRNAEYTEKSRIRVENINGPVMMVSAEDDGCWPSKVFSDMIEERLKAVRHPWRIEHLFNEKAGHSIGFPYVPINETVVTHPVSGLVMDFGGTRDINAEASRRSWRRVMTFLRRAPEYYAEGLALRETK